VSLGVQAGQGLQHHRPGAGEQPGPHSDAVHCRVSGGEVVEPTAVLDLTEAFLDRGAVAEPRFQPDQVAGVGGDVVTMKLTAQT